MEIINFLSVYAIPIIIFIIIIYGLFEKKATYDIFIEGAKDGAKVTFNIIPYLVAIIVGISMFRASGVIDSLGNILAPLLSKFNVDRKSVV